MSSFRRQGGSVLLYSLVVLALGSLLFLGWIELLNARSVFVSTFEQAVKARLSRSNGDAVLRRALTAAALPSTAGTAFQISLADNWGGAKVFTAWTEPPLASTAQAPFANHFSPGGGGGFVLQLAAEVETSRSTEPRRAMLCSRSPTMGGRLLTFQKPTLVPSASISSNTGIVSTRGAMLWAPLSPNSYGFQTTWFCTPDSATTPPAMAGPSSTSTAPSNLAWPPIFSTDFTGSLDVLDPAAFPANSMSAKFASLSPLAVDADVEEDFGTPDVNGVYPVSSDGSGAVSVALSLTGYTAIEVSNVSTLELVGSAGGQTGTVWILVNQGVGSTRDLQTVSLSGSNTRPVYLGVKKSSASDVLLQISGGAHSGIFTFENCPVQIDAPSGTQLAGGMRSDRSIQINSGSLSFVLPDSFPSEALLDRQAWLELYAP